MKQECQVIDSFSGQYEMFSNFYPVIIEFACVKFPTVEHAYVASKSVNFSFWMTISQLPADKAGKAKYMGRKIKIRKDWNMVKLAFMKKFLLQKFNQEPYKQLLLSTGDSLLIEGNYWHDNYWGDCKCQKCKDIIGQNNLGKMLMRVRGIIK